MLQHPSFKFGRTKELLFWKGDDSPLKSKKATCDSQESNDYLKQLEYVPAPVDSEYANTCTGEFSATYFECACCPRLFKQIVPNAKMLVMLRDPIERAQSRFKEQKAFKRMPPDVEWDSFRDAHLKSLKDCLAMSTDHMQRASCAEQDNVLGWSLHDVFLKHWIDAGYNSGNLHILYLDYWSANATSQMREAESFLGLSPATYIDTVDRSWNTAGNYGWHKHSMMQVASGEAELEAFFAESVRHLRELCEEGGWAAPPVHWTAT